MTVNQVGDLLSRITALYPSFKMADVKGTVAMWTDILANDDAQQIYGALKIYSREPHEFAPTAGQLIQIVKENTEEKIDKLECVNLLRKALSNSNYGAKEEFEQLPEVVQMAVGSPSELHRIGMSGWDSYTEHRFLERLDLAIDRMECRKNQAIINGIEQKEQKLIEG